MREPQKNTQVTTLRGSEGASESDLGFLPGGGGSYYGGYPGGGGSYNYGGLPGGGGGLNFDPINSLDFGVGNLDLGPGSLSFNQDLFQNDFGFQSSISGLNFDRNGLNISPGFDFGRDVLGQLPVNAIDSSLPSFSKNDLPGSGGDFGWKELIGYLIAMGPRYIEAWTRGRGHTPADAPPAAKSESREQRKAALRRAIQNQRQGGGGATLGGITATQALGGAALVASLIAIVQSS
jgi:hypothetical protein